MRRWNLLAVGLMLGLAACLSTAAAQDLSGATVRDFKNFLVLESKDQNRNIVVLRASLVASLMDGKSYSEGDFEHVAAETAGILFAVRSGNAVSNADAAASGDDVASRAAVKRVTKLSDLVGNIQLPSGWAEAPVVVVVWSSSRAVMPSVAAQTGTESGSQVRLPGPGAAGLDDSGTSKRSAAIEAWRIEMGYVKANRATRVNGFLVGGGGGALGTIAVKEKIPDIDSDAFRFSPVDSVEPGDWSAFVTGDQAWSMTNVELNHSAYPVVAMVKISNGKVSTVVPGVLKAKVDIAAGTVFQSKGYVVESHQPIKAGAAIPVLLVGDSIFSVEGVEGQLGGSKPWFTAFPDASGSPAR